jgi:hypothetical protein
MPGPNPPRQRLGIIAATEQQKKDNIAAALAKLREKLAKVQQDINSKPKRKSKSKAPSKSKSKKAVVCKSAADAARVPAPKGKRDPRSVHCGGDGRAAQSSEARARAAKARQAKFYAMALKGINKRGKPYTDSPQARSGLKKMGLQLLPSGEVVPL